MVKAPGFFGTFKTDKHGLTVRMVDHILVSGNLCGTTGLCYREDSIVASDAIVGASDHAAIGARITY